MSTLSINKEKYLKLKEEYKEATISGKESFPFEGNMLLVSYAKYLIEYLTGIYELKKTVSR